MRTDEVAAARKLLQKRTYLWDKLPEFEARKKKAEFLTRRGFDWEVVKKLLKSTEGW